MTPKQQDLFFEIIKYLNDNNRQWDSRLWETELGHVWIYFGRHGWEAHWFEESKWPICNMSCRTDLPECPHYEARK